MVYWAVHILFNGDCVDILSKNNLIAGKPELKEKIKGKLDLATKYCQKKMKHSGNSFKEFKNRTFDPCVWHKFQEDVSQPYYKLQKFWYHQRDVLLYTEYDVLFTRLGKKLMEM